MGQLQARLGRPDALGRSSRTLRHVQAPVLSALRVLSHASSQTKPPAYMHPHDNRPTLNTPAAGP
jgi:hypothetical protein